MAPVGEERVWVVERAGALRLVDVASGRETDRIDVGRAIYSAGFDPTNRWVYLAAEDDGAC